MTRDEKQHVLETMLRKCPDCLSPTKAANWSPLGKNHVYDLIKTGELRSFVYRGGYIIAKADLIEYLLDHCDEKSKRFTVKNKGNGNE